MDDVRTIQRSALQFAVGPCEFGTTSGSATEGDIPVRMVARSPKPVFHKDFPGGPVVHDFSGMRKPDSRIPLDYAHDTREVIGFADRFESGPDGLEVGGTLIPFRDGDRASEIKFKSDKGVPYQSSIFFDDATAEIIDRNESAEVNGQRIVGPATIIRQWTLRGVAICPYGVDKNTPVRLSVDGETTITLFHKEPAMADPVAPVEVPAEAVVELPKVEETFSLKPAVEGELAADGKRKCAACGEFSMPEDGKCGKCGKPVDTEDDSSEEEPDSKFGITRTGKDYLDAFGDKGARWFIEGKTWDEAQSTYVGELKSELSAAQAKLAAAPVQFGEVVPLSNGIPAETATNPELDALEQKLGSRNLAKFAASIELSKK